MTRTFQPSETDITVEEAARVLQRNEELFAAGAIGEILEGFTDDVVVEFADVPRVEGKRALERFLAARFARQKDYRLHKRLRAVTGNVIIGTWTGEWEDAVTGNVMAGRGSEFLEMRGSCCARWEATFNAWEAGRPQQSLFV